MKNKVEAQTRKVNKKNHVVEPIHDVDIKHSLLNANFEPTCATCKKSMFDGVHDKCLLDFVENVNSHAKSAKKHKKQNIWKPTGHVFTKVGLKWKPTSRTFTIVGNPCLLTRITSANAVLPKKTTSDSVETQKPELKVYSSKPKNVKNVGSSKKAKIVESKNSNHSKPNHTWGSNATDIPSSSSLVMTGCPDCSLLDSGTTILQRLWGKIKKSSHQPKAKHTSQEKLYLLHMDLCGPMRVASINWKRYILVIVDDYSRFTWVRFLKTKDEAPEAIIKCIKNIQVCLNPIVRNVRTDNGTEFVNQKLREFYENVGISHQTSVARTPQQNNIVESSGRIPNTVTQQPCIPSNKDDWDHLYEPMFDEYFTPPSIAITPVQEASEPRAAVLAESHLKSRWSGPFTISHVFPYGTVELSQNSRPNFKVNGHRIKHYF
ncbi:retrovirus-related pol polyprotein from transposon TNT 1-94 [Tanacetum coccineum]